MSSEAAQSSAATEPHEPVAVGFEDRSNEDIEYGATDRGATGREEVHKTPSTPQSQEQTEHSVSRSAVTDSPERPPLPPRPSIDLLWNDEKNLHNQLRVPSNARPRILQSQATTALSLTDIQTHSFPDGSRETYASSTKSTPSKHSFRFDSPAVTSSQADSEQDDLASIASFAPTVGRTADAESLLGEVFGGDEQSRAWRLLNPPDEKSNPFETIAFDDEEPTADFNREFDELPEMDADGSNEEALLEMWKSKRKQFIILSAAGKPIYSRHGSDNLISGQIGVIQTIISFYEGVGDALRGFTAGGTRFAVMARGPLYLVAISKLGESDTQLKIQLEALYMQILSTLTLPTLTQLFSNRPSMDLRRPLQGTESLLSALADSFTRGSPSTLLSALECLKLKNQHRQAINNTVLKVKSKTLLYGLIVAGGRLVSVVRPRTHSLHPGDLQLIFNMLFEAGGIKSGGGESWIPMCLPGFNKNGYLYMYVSFVDVKDSDAASNASEAAKEDQVAVLLISGSKESFFELQGMRNKLVDDLEKTGKMAIIRHAVLAGRPNTTDIIPGTVVRHFLYKSRGNLQYVMPSYEPYFNTLLERRRLISLYHNLNASVHSKLAHLKVHHCVSRDSISLAWITPLFELYCVAPSNASRNALAQSANKIVQWVRREEERIFIIGGAVF